MPRIELKLEIERVGERYRARVRKAPVGEGATSWFDLPAEAGFAGDAPDLTSPSRHLTIDSSGRRGSPQSLGRHLFEKVFTGPVLTAWRASLATSREGDLLLRLRLDDDPRLLSVPWELLFDPERGTFLATERRVIRSLGRPVRVRQLGTPAPFRILVVLSCPSGVARLDMRQEWAVLDEALGDKVELKPVAPNLKEIDHALQSGEWHALHFVGHGGTDAEGGFLVLENREGDARTVDHLRLGKILSHPSLRLVVLNACEGARPGQTDAFSGVAQALVRKGVPAVVAMQKPISDATAIAFAKSFYGALAEERTVGTALWKAREDLFRDHEPEWSIPVLYLSGKDVPLIKPLPATPSSRRLLVARLTAGTLMLAFFGLAISQLSPPEPPPPGLLSTKPPRGSEENPEGCTSPRNLDIAFIRIDRGPFEMGEKKERHRVWITDSFCIGVYEVTQELWNRVLDKPYPPAGEEHIPVREITVEEIRQFLARLNEIDPSGHYRLPTEAEWERAARAGTRTRFYFGEDETDLPRHGNCKGGKDGFADPAPVGQLAESPAGLYDIYGNVFEWVSDWYGPYTADPAGDPKGPPTGEKRIRRGGGWDSAAKTCSSAARSIVQPDRSDKFTGFRIVREIH